MIGDQVKLFRNKKGITQEELGKMVGVTTQAVSKWERGGVPDAELLPYIADALGVTIDMLFGRNETLDSMESSITDELLSMTRKEGFNKSFSLLWSIILGLSGLSSLKESFGDCVLDNLKDKNGNHYYSRMCFDDGIINAKMDVGNRYFFLMSEPEDGLKNFFDNIDELAETLSVFGNKDILKILFYMYSRNNVPIALSLISSRTGIPIEKTEKLMEKLCNENLAKCAMIETENGQVKVYSFFNETVVMPLLCSAKELRDTKVINWGIMFDRNKPLF